MLIFFNNKSQSNVMGKTLEYQFVHENVYLKNPVSVTHPVFVISNMGRDIYKINYVYDNNFKRFYFIDEIRTIATNEIEIICSCDVLETYRTKILNTSQYVIRQSNMVQSQVFSIIDKQLPFYTSTSQEIVKFPERNVEGGHCMILRCV